MPHRSERPSTTCRVFLSSTSHDLAIYRDAVHRAVDGLPGFELVKMEDFGARDANAKDLCAELVRGCDLLVGVMGHYYGSCPPGDTVSFTELEYRTATAANIPRLMFVAPNDFPIPASVRGSDASFERQQRLRREVMTDRVVASFSTPEQLASAVTKALFVWHEERRNPAPSPGEAPAVFQFPAGTETLGPNPYRGLEAFRKEDADRFFGREALVQELWEKFIALHAPTKDREAGLRLLAILGPSGTGKSSVAQAGLLAKLDRDPLPGRPNPRSVVLTPEARPLESLATALVHQATTSPSAKAIAEFEEVLRTRAKHDGLRFLTDRLLDVGPAGVVILVDQFEEAFALCQDEGERSNFIGNLLRAAGEPKGRVSLILTLRTDFIDATRSYPELNSLVSRQNVVVPVMREAELRRAIVEPAKRGGRDIDQSTVDLLIEQTVGREGALPALEFVLTRIWDGFKQGVSAADTVRQLGGVGGALAEEAKRLYDSLSGDQKAVVRRAFLAMTMLGEGTKDTRRRAPIDEMVVANQSEADVRRVLEVFADPDRRLVTLAADKDGKTIAEVAHEALFDHWSELRRWLDQDRDRIRFARRLEGAVREWIDAGRPKGMLWRPPLLDLLRGYAHDMTGDMPAGQLAFFDASEREHRRGTWIRRAGIAAAIGGLLLVAGGMTIYSRQQAEFAERQAELRESADAAKREAVRHAETADARRDEVLRTQSLLLAELSEQETRSGDATNGILLALQALPKDGAEPVDEVVAALYRATSVHRELAVLRGHEDVLRSATFSPDGAKVVTASRDGTARLWSVASGQALAVLQGHDWGVNSASFNPDGSKVVTASADRSARLWDTASGKELAVLHGHEDVIRYATFSPDGDKIVTASDDRMARLWDAAAGNHLAVLQGHKARVISAAFSPDGSKVVTASEDRTARLWDTASGNELAVLQGHEGGVNSAAFSRDGAKVVTASEDRTARLWNSVSGQVLVLRGHDDVVRSAAFSRDGAKVVTASDDRTARLWDAVSGKELAVLRGHEDWVRSAAFSPDGVKVVTTSYDRTARLWDGASGNELAVLQGHEGSLNSATFSRDGAKVVTASEDRTARLWDTASREVLAVLRGHEGVVNSVAVSPDGSKVVTASGDRTARLWGTATRKELVVLRGHEDRVWSAAFSPDGTKVVTASEDRTARLWDAASGKELSVLHGHEDVVRYATFSPGGAKVVTASWDRTARLWDAASGEELARLQGHTAGVISAAFSSDGAKVVTASDDRTARLWDVASGIELAVLQGHEGGVNSAALSPDGAKVVTASDDRTARLWDVASGTELAVLQGHEGSVNSATFSRDGAKVVTASEDRTARLWRVFTTTPELIDYARRIVPRQLTPEQRELFPFGT